MQDKTDPMNMFHSRKKAKVIRPDQAKRKHEEADLHLAFCKWVKLQYPKLDFIRHEREKQRSFLMQNLFKMYNTENDKMPDFELLNPSGKYHRLYIEFKKPGTKLTLRDNITIKPEYSGQYARHMKFWDEDSCAYFCSDLLEAQKLLRYYMSGYPEAMQEFEYEGKPIPKKKSRCCGRCDGVSDICVADTICDDHEIMGCEICFGER